MQVTIEKMQKIGLNNLKRNSMAEIPTAELFRGTKLMDSSKPYTEEEIMIEFAKLHVEAALKAASENGKAYFSEVFEEYTSDVDSDSILNSYPLENIE